MHSLRDKMIKKTAAERHARWRTRFLEIARQAEGGAPPTMAAAVGLRLRMRTPAAFVELRRSRPA